LPRSALDAPTPIRVADARRTIPVAHANADDATIDRCAVARAEGLRG